MNMHCKLIIVGVGAGLMATALAEVACERPIRRLEVREANSIFTLREGMSSIEVSHTVSGSTSEVINYVHSPGAVETLVLEDGDDAGDVYEYLAVGCDSSGGGVLQCILDTGSGSAQHSAIHSLPGDATGIVYSRVNDVLYVLDATNSCLLSLSHSPGMVSLPVISTLATESDIPELADGERYFLAMEADGATPQLRLVEYGSVYPATVLFELQEGSKPVWLERTFGSRDFAHLSDVHVVAGAVSIPVSGPPHMLVSVVRLDGSTAGVAIGSAVTGPRGDAVVSLTVPLDIHERYAARTSAMGVPSGPGLVPVLRWGANTASGLPMHDGFQMRPFGAIANDFCVGNSGYYFGVRCEHTSSQPVIVPVEYRAILLMGVQGLHSIVNTPAGPLLQAGWSKNGLLNVQRPTGGAAIVDVPVPADRGLEGVVILAQWVVVGTGGSSYALSDIVGMSVRANESLNSAVNDEPETAISDGLTASDRVEAWMKQAQFEKCNKGFLQRIEAHLAHKKH